MARIRLVVQPSAIDDGTLARFLQALQAAGLREEITLLFKEEISVTPIMTPVPKPRVERPSQMSHKELMHRTEPKNRKTKNRTTKSILFARKHPEVVLEMATTTEGRKYPRINIYDTCKNFDITPEELLATHWPLKSWQHSLKRSMEIRQRRKAPKIKIEPYPRATYE